VEYYHLFKIVQTLQVIKQTAIAKQIGITQQAIALFESGKSTLSDKTLSKIAPLLNLNPAYLGDKSSNPFLSNNIINFSLLEGIDGVDYSIIYFIAEHNKYLNFIYFTSPSPLYSKYRSNTVYGYPTIAIGIKDADDNTFLLKRMPRKPLFGERELIAKLEEINSQGKSQIVIDSKTLSVGEEKKFLDFSITKDEADKYFTAINYATTIITKTEDKLIQYIRKNNIEIQKLIEHLEAAARLS
jgi:transcriptional regulator with XRE-family HTH domain